MCAIPTTPCVWRQQPLQEMRRASRSAVACSSYGRLAQDRLCGLLLPAHCHPCSRGYDVGYPELTLPSGAGHDAAIMSQITEIAMLFVRCAVE